MGKLDQANLATARAVCASTLAGIPPVNLDRQVTLPQSRLAQGIQLAEAGP
jgi:hypothetical protein